MTTIREERGTISDAVAAVADMTRKGGLTDEESADLVSSLAYLMGDRPLPNVATAEDVLALVTLVREFHQFSMSNALRILPRTPEDNVLLHFSGRVDSALTQAVSALENLAGRSAVPFVWGSNGRFQ